MSGCWRTQAYSAAWTCQNPSTATLIGLLGVIGLLGTDTPPSSLERMLRGHMRLYRSRDATPRWEATQPRHFQLPRSAGSGAGGPLGLGYGLRADFPEESAPSSG